MRARSPHTARCPGRHRALIVALVVIGSVAAAACTQASSSAEQTRPDPTDTAPAAASTSTIAATITLPEIAADATDEVPRFESDVILDHVVGTSAYALPKIVQAPDASLLIVAQDRQGGDWGSPITPLTMRSVDRGQTWSEPSAFLPNGFIDADRYAYEATGVVVDQRAGRILVFVQRNPLRDSDGEPMRELWYYEHVQETHRLGRAWFLVHSDDSGGTWSEPIEITDQLTKEPHCTPYDPVHTGLQLTRGAHAGRLMVPARYYCADQDPSEHDFENQYNGLLYSDDGGVTWIPGARSEPVLGECVIAERSDGSIYVNHRTARGQRRPPERMQQVSTDGGETLTPAVPSGLIDNRSHAGLTVAADATGRPVFLLSSLPTEEGFGNRRGLSISVSFDEGESWTTTRVVEDGHSGYSDLTVADDGTVVVVYETGERSAREDLAVARFNLAWALDVD